MTQNILEAYKKQKEEQKQKRQGKPKHGPEPQRTVKKREVLNCHGCVHCSIYDSGFDNQIINKRVYCRKWAIAVKSGRAKHCPHYQATKDKELDDLKNKK